MNNDVQREQKLLRRSMWAGVSQAVLGIGFFFVTKSQAIMLDGFFSLINVGVDLITIRVAGMVSRPDDRSFQFGYGMFEPVLNLGRGLVIGATSLLVLVSSIGAFFQGGRPISSDIAVIYAVLAASTCFLMAWVQQRAFRQTQSPLIEVDAKQWWIGGAISSAVGAAFVGGAILERTAFAPWVDYLDPSIVVILVILTISVPIRIVRENLWQVLLGAPGKEVQEKLKSTLDGVLDRHGFNQYNLRIARAGRSSLLLIHVLVPDDSSSAKEVSALDGVRSKLHDALASELTHYSLDVVFTQDRKWLT